MIAITAFAGDLIKRIKERDRSIAEQDTCLEAVVARVSCHHFIHTGSTQRHPARQNALKAFYRQEFFLNFFFLSFYLV